MKLEEIKGMAGHYDKVEPLKDYYEWAKQKNLEPQARTTFQKYVREKHLNPNAEKELEKLAKIGQAY